MTRRWMFRLVPVALAAVVMLYQFVISPKYTNPETGRTAHLGLTTQQESALGMQSFQQVISQSDVVSSGPEAEQVRRVAARLAAVTGPYAKDFEWQVAVVRDPQVNAFCLPGGKICVYTGILAVTKTDAGLATVMGHEMAHATSHHGAERMFKQNMTQTAMMGVQGSMGGMDYQQQQMVMGLLGAGAKFGVLLPFSRDHESEADKVGLMYMARAGYDPRESVNFWKRMAESSQGKQQPEFMSTHPVHETRIRQLEAWIPEVMDEYEAAAKPAER
ncbi:MAG: M48 family metallopeptidase [Planctomycetes bacterium]|nr:M48 family metallopeptidase [Planctomycetota bacterium]